MRLPNLSNSMYVARLRHIQSIHESTECRNPDTLVRHFLPFRERLKVAWIGQRALARLRSDPFYYYIVARTKYYDSIINEAVANGVQRVVGVGCGSDTRAYRFDDLLKSRSVRVLECDQSEAIRAKQRIVRPWRHLSQVEYLPIDLNDYSWPGLEQWLQINPSAKTLVMMEGVSPYVNEDAFGRFLQLLAKSLGPGSQLAYDFKIAGVKDAFGLEGRTQKPFRLSQDRNEVTSFHLAHGFRIDHMELSSELTVRLLPCLTHSAVPMFDEDGLVRLSVIKG